MSYSYKQWGTETTADNVIHASDLERWQDGITDAGGTWSGSWTDEKDTLTAEQLNALETEIASLYGTGFTAKTWEDGQVPGVDEWNRIEDAINTILNRTAFAIYCETDNSLTFYVDTEVPAVGDTYEGKAVTAVYTGLENTNWTAISMQLWYDVRDTLTAITFDKSFSICKPTSFLRWFSGCNQPTYSGLDNIDTSKATTLERMFYNVSSLTDTSIRGIANWDISNVTNLNYTFYGCSGLTSLEPLANWNISSATNLNYMFYGCSGLTSADVSKWNTQNVTNLSYMFRECTSLTTLGSALNWDTSKVTTTEAMFYGCSALVINAGAFSSWNMSKVTTSRHMFYNCANLLSVSGLENWNMSAVTTMDYMFYGCTGLTDLTPLSGWDVSNVTDLRQIFNGCSGITDIDVSKWNISGAADMSYVFQGMTALEELDLSGWDTSNATSMNYMFNSDTALKTVYVAEGQFNTDKVTSSTGMFQRCSSIVGGNGTTFDSSKIDASMAHIDTEDNPGYFTAKG